MTALVSEVPIPRRLSLDDYRPYEQPGEEIATLRERARAVARLLGAGKVWMLSSTAAGGGVAEMLPTFGELLNDLGIDTRWLVLTPGDAAFFQATKTIHNMLHGMPGRITEEMREAYLDVSRAAAEELRAHVNAGDVLLVHDPQPLGVGWALPPEHRPRLCWRCHIGVPQRNEATSAAWSFLRPFLEPYERLIFSAEQYIPDDLLSRSGVQSPALDPLSNKNIGLTPHTLIGILRSAELVAGPPVPDAVRFDQSARRYSEGQWVQSPIPDLIFLPVIVQVSRFDRLKGFDRLIEGFTALVRCPPDCLNRMTVDTTRAALDLASVQLVLAGPDPGGVKDDPEAEVVLNELCQQISRLDRATALRVHLVRLPLANVQQNALMVNALQRLASVIAQLSAQEGFGLTVTEALWKGVPLVATNVGGIAQQVRPNIDGTLLNDATPEAVANALLQSLVDRSRADAMAREAHSRVRRYFLIPPRIAGWLGEAERLLSTPAPSVSKERFRAVPASPHMEQAAQSSLSQPHSA